MQFCHRIFEERRTDWAWIKYRDEIWKNSEIPWKFRDYTLPFIIPILLERNLLSLIIRRYEF